MKTKLKFSARLIIFIGMLSTLLPFVNTISGYSETRKAITGVQMLRKFTLEFTKVEPNLLLIAALILGLVAIVLSALKKDKQGGVAALLSVGLLLLFKLTFKIYYDVETYNPVPDVRFRFGWYITIICIAVGAVILFLRDKNSTD